jgi:hypothetical protein
MTFVGFDLHKRYISACALTETGEILAGILSDFYVEV